MMKEWLTGQGLWRVGFTQEALPLINLMSGLVDIHETIWDDQHKLLVFIVGSLDQTGVLFKRGVLRANPILRYQKSNQAVLAPS